MSGQRVFGPSDGASEGRAVDAAAPAAGKRSLTERLPVQRKAAGRGGAGGTAATTGLQLDDPFGFHLPAASGGGDRMPAPVQRKMEQSFATSFDDVRVHQGPQAGAIGATAYAQGSDVHFAPGAYDPASRGGQELLGHELAHVVQQREGRAGTGAQGHGLPVNDDAGLEREADELGARAARGEDASGGRASAGSSASGAAPVQLKLNLVAGYTEALNWSHEAQVLMQRFDALVELNTTLEALRAQMTGRPFRGMRTRLGHIGTFITNLERQRIPNDHGVRVAKTALVDAQILAATQLHADVLARLGQLAPKKDADDLDGPEANRDAVEATPIAEDKGSHTLVDRSESATPEATPTATPSATPTGPVSSGNSTAPSGGGTVTPPKPMSTAVAVIPETSKALTVVPPPMSPIGSGPTSPIGSGPTSPTPTPTPTPTPVLPGHDNTTAVAPTGEAPNGTPTGEGAPAEEEDAPPGLLQSIELKLFEIEKRKGEHGGRLGTVSGEAGGGAKASGADGVAGELKGKVKIVLGKAGEKTSEPLDLRALAHGSKVQVRAKGEVLLGAKAEVGASGGVKAGPSGVSGSLKGTASAFAGGSVEVAPQIRIVDAEGKPMASFTGIGGLTYGVGGAVEGEVSFEGWKIVFKWKGKASAGVGVAWGFAGEIDAAQLGSLYHAIFG